MYRRQFAVGSVSAFAVLHALADSEAAGRHHLQVESCLRMLHATTGGAAFMHESFDADDPTKYTRPWFAWCNSLFGEPVVRISESHPSILKRV